MLVEATERTQKVALAHPDALHGVVVNFAKAIAIVVSGILALGMVDAGVWASAVGQVLIASRSVCKDHGVWFGVVHDELFQSGFVGVFDDLHAHFRTLTSNDANNGRTIIVEGALASAFVAPATGLVFGIVVPFSFGARVLEHLVGFDLLVG